MLPRRLPAAPAAPRTAAAHARGYAVVDVEATGRSPWRHRVVEVAVVALDRFLHPVAEYTTLIDPEGPVGPTHVHRITQDEVAGAPRFREVAPQLLELLSGRLLVGHHVACDRAFLEREFARIGVDLPPVPSLCTMRLARDHLPAAGGFGLRACAEAAGLPPFAAHTALGDALTTADLLRHCAARHPARPLRPAEWTRALREAAALAWPSLAAPRVPPARCARTRANAPAAAPVPDARGGDA
ncbi:3'-5' exonuclease [Streptacidiphilus sp. ASG 303]|uniref:3'-5' exonuclease n=1 Tax=Streptacidiphilus sp. ASG 303 TaxID=2896847 RepID=UPI001E4CCE36|nr:3'-5' exonuclease [Streptacidiphilus sp. ASG 303]MCD0485269.1 3'-5' exonuclease [Streptacidiphilus sp. ASG 303]